MLYQQGFLNTHSMYVQTPAKTFWKCFKNSLEENQKGDDGKRRILSIIAQDFTYQELQEKLGVFILYFYTFDLYNKFFFMNNNILFSL